jgi:aspartyl-tRNA(Asn)/glutamyl-tRNA(Gln) amidotransferase subunit A
MYPDIQISFFHADVVSGWDSKDVTLSPDPHVTCADKLSDFKPGIRIGLLKGFSGSVRCVEYCSTIDEAAQHFEHQGASIKEIEMTEFFNCVPAYYILTSTEAVGNMSKYRRMVNASASWSACDIGHVPPDEWMKELRDSTRSRLTIGQSSHFPEGKAQHKAATQTRRNMVKQFREAFKEVDLVLTPTTIGPPLSTEDYLALDTAGSGALVTFTCPVNMCGLPAISIPIGRTKDNLPLGVQLIANHFQEHSLLQAAHFLLSCMRA